jgi:hypothetical protein
MLGMVFTELLEMVEQAYSFDVADAVIARAGARGAYTAVGEYPDEELMALVSALSAETGVAAPDLLHAYGRHLFGRFVAGFPIFFDGHRDAMTFLAGLEGRVHTEVRKLYAGSKPPLFVLSDGPNGARLLDYHSPRALWRFAQGLLEACLAHFGHDAEGLLVEDLSGGAGTHVRFTIPGVA